MKKYLLLLAILVSLQMKSVADEGMWLPLLIERLNYVDMQKEGLHLTAEEIYSVNHSSLKDAIIMFGGGCTGEIVSPEGLIFTNHHCGYGSIQSHSTVDHDYLTDGFWAFRKEEELPNPGLTARFLISIQDVTTTVLGSVNDNMPESERNEKIKKAIREIEENFSKGTKYNARVSSFFNGNEYYLFVYEVYRDVRLVGAPPSSIGKFGADTDNWMWPRHTGDFSIFRVYTAKDGSPADYSPDNVPMKPKHYLPVSLKGVNKGDYSMIMGYPGSTDRFATSYTIDWAVNKHNPAVVKIRTEKLGIMKKDMDADPAVRIKYASKYAGTANYWKFYIGQNKGLKRLDVEQRKRETEERFSEWINANRDRNLLYRDALYSISKAYETLNRYELAMTYNNEAINRGCEIISFSRQFNSLAIELQAKNPDQEAIEKIIGRCRTSSDQYFKNYNAGTDKQLLAAMLNLYFTNVPRDQQPAYLKTLYSKKTNSFSDYAARVFSKSIFADQQKLEAFLQNPNLKKLQKDPIWPLQIAFAENAGKIDSLTRPADELLSRGKRLFVRGLRQMEADKSFYPDANSTMRLTYGKVDDYSPQDAVDYDFVTTLDGIMQKEDPSSWEFVVPAKLKQLYQDKDYGRYGKNGKMVVGFITNNDITGGNSGSPVLNADGELIGLAFDGNWEAMSGNYAFEPDLQRTICVDIRYVLFIIDKFAGAKNLIDELTLKE
ncbi:MAG TPA: S46 family peptidase [Bacteroidales bacterium]|nr:S46 family peptidase [Bacteroidales bacterium]HPT02469.1 S46 family peptidase [Bacteroidales bacterium]